MKGFKGLSRSVGASLTRARMEARIRCEDLLSEFAEREKKREKESQPIHWVKKDSQRIHLGYPRTG